jgi:hypothetical protein
MIEYKKKFLLYLMPLEKSGEIINLIKGIINYFSN